jgi:TonB family protein
MTRRQDLLTGLLVALLVHLSALVFAGSIFRARRSVLIPMFAKGESALALTLVTLPIEDKVIEDQPEPEPAPLLTDPLSEIDAPSDPPKPKKEEPPPVPELADMEEKGVTSNASLVDGFRYVYPHGSVIRGEAGKVTLSILVSAAGRATRVSVLNSSGYPALDRTAKAGAFDTPFHAASSNGQPREATIELTVTFELD